MKINNFTQFGERANYAFNIRLTKNQKIRLKVLADAAGFNTVSSYVRFMLFNPALDMKIDKILEIVRELHEKRN
ncbi:MAG: hypothetical protein ABIH59_02880 [archaeon]